MHIDPENWMGALSSEKLSAPLITIAIPGSHDSMTYSITPKSPVAPDAEPIVQTLMKYCGFIIRPVVYRWCLTQSLTVLEQLTLGIRYFDIRVATKQGSREYFFVHGLYGEQVNLGFKFIQNFLTEHKNEIVILDMQHFYQFTMDNHYNYISVLKEIFGELLCPKPHNAASISLQWMRQEGYQVIVIYRDDFAKDINEVWNSNQWPTPWPETMSVNDLLKFLEVRLAKRPKNCGFVSQCVLTPTFQTVVKSPFSNVRSKCALPACQATVPWLHEKEPGIINVAIADFIQINEATFPNTVLSLNFK